MQTKYFKKNQVLKDKKYNVLEKMDEVIKISQTNGYISILPTLRKIKTLLVEVKDDILFSKE